MREEVDSKIIYPEYNNQKFNVGKAYIIKDAIKSNTNHKTKQLVRYLETIRMLQLQILDGLDIKDAVLNSNDETYTENLLIAYYKLNKDGICINNVTYRIALNEDILFVLDNIFERRLIK